MNLKSKSLIYLLAFIEGASLLVCEISSAKIIETYFGVSLYVWASVISITLSGLAIGYFLGGNFSNKKNNTRILFYLFLLSGLYFIFIPTITDLILINILDIGLILGTIISAIIILLPPMIMFGSIGPILIQNGSKGGDAGKVAGYIYAISTFGGVLNVLLVVLLFLPHLGISTTFYIYGIILILSSLIIAPKPKFKKAAAAFLFIMISIGTRSFILSDSYQNNLLYSRSNQFENKPLNNLNILYSSNGLFGKVEVADIDLQLNQQIEAKIRGLIVNNTWQTLNNRVNGISMLQYVPIMEGIIRALPKQKEILHIGLGGGQLSKIMDEMGRKVTSVELDKRVVASARKYFALPRSVEVIVDDGRHFLNRNKRVFDMVIVNAFKGDVPPWTLFTKNSFERCYKSTKDDGLLMVEIGGYFQKGDDKLLASILSTIEAAGWKLILLQSSNTIDVVDFICIGYKNEKPDISSAYWQVTQHRQNLQELVIDRNQFVHPDQTVFTDDLSALPKWRAQGYK